MIREYNTKDQEQIEMILAQGIKINKEDINFILEKSDQVLVYDIENVGVVGFSTYRLWGKEKNKADVYTYVKPSYRRQGIGGILYKEICKNVQKNRLEFISARTRVDIENTSEFYGKLGYEPWYVEHELEYHGGKQPDSELQFVQYENRYFEQYANGLRNCFYELRKSNDFVPYYCCELNEAKRQEFLSMKESIYLLLQEDKLVASVMICDNGLIEDLFVLPEYRGKDYGKKMMQFAINKALEGNNSHISLSAIEWNKRALNLYKGLGFDIVQSTKYLRSF